MTSRGISLDQRRACRAYVKAWGRGLKQADLATPDVRKALHAFRRARTGSSRADVSPWGAVLRGHLMVTLPVVAIFTAVFMLARYVLGSERSFYGASPAPESPGCTGPSRSRDGAVGSRRGTATGSKFSDSPKPPVLFGASGGSSRRRNFRAKAGEANRKKHSSQAPGRHRV